MELWIRSQDKTKLCQARYFELDNDKTGIFCFNGESYSVFAGKYKTKERALEVLDEIQKKFNSRIYIKSKGLMTLRDLERAKITLEELNNQELTIIDNSFELIPTSDDVVIYEMPQE